MFIKENQARHLYSLKLHNKEDRMENFYTKDEDAPKKKAKKSWLVMGFIMMQD